MLLYSLESLQRCQGSSFGFVMLSLIAGMPEGYHRKRHKAGLRYSSKKQLERSKMVRRLHRASGAEISSTIRTLSYEDSGCDVGDFQSGDNLAQNIVRFDSVEESEEDVRQSTSTANVIIHTSAQFVSLSIQISS